MFNFSKFRKNSAYSKHMNTTVQQSFMLVLYVFYGREVDNHSNCAVCYITVRQSDKAHFFSFTWLWNRIFQTVLREHGTV